MKKIQLILIAPFLLSCDAFEDDEPEMDGYSVGKPASYVIHYPDGKTSIHQFVWDGNNVSRYRDNDLWIEVKNNDYGYGLEYQYYKPDGSKGTKRVYERSKDKVLSFKEYDSSGNLVKKDSFSIGVQQIIIYFCHRTSTEKIGVRSTAADASATRS